MLFLQHKLSRCFYNISCHIVSTILTVTLFLQHKLSHCFYNISCHIVSTILTVTLFLQHKLSRCFYNISCHIVSTILTVTLFLQHKLSHCFCNIGCQSEDCCANVSRLDALSITDSHFLTFVSDIFHVEVDGRGKGKEYNNTTQRLPCHQPHFTVHETRPHIIEHTPL